MIRAIIVDDEDHVRENFKSIITSNFKQVKLVGEAFSVASAVEQINEKQPQLVFLDIDLLDGSGFNVLEQIKNPQIGVIFVTAHNEFAIKAIRYNAWDYILKPIDLKELENAIEQAVRRQGQLQITKEDLNHLFENLNRSQEERKLVIHNEKSIVYLKVGEIMRCEADGHYTTFFLKNGNSMVASKTLKEYESILPQSSFFRVHKSHLINLGYVVQFSREGGDVIIMEDQSEIPVARRRKDTFLSQMRALNS